jgi:thioredoxin reductase (NADPH)
MTIQALIGERSPDEYNCFMDYQVIIIGGGPAGISALLWCHSLGLQAVLLEQAAELGGQMLEMFHPVLEYPGFPNKTGHELRDEFAAHLDAYKLSYHFNCQIDEINLRERRLVVNGKNLNAQAFILATGACNRRLGLPGEAALHGISYSATRDVGRFAGQDVCVVGGGDSAFEDCLILAQSCPRVTLIHRSDKFRARPSWQQAVFTHPRIDVLAHCQIIEINQRDEQLLHLTLTNDQDKSQSELIVNGLFVRLGIAPNTAFLRGQLALDEAGYIVTDRAQKTSIANVYAVGDVCRPICLSVSTALGHGAIAAKGIAETLRQLSTAG